MGRLKKAPEYVFSDYIHQHKQHISISNELRLLDNDLMHFCNVFLICPPRYENLPIQPEEINTFSLSNIWGNVTIDWDGLTIMSEKSVVWVEKQLNKAVKLNFIYPDGSLHPLLAELLKRKSKMHLEKVLSIA